MAKIKNHKGFTIVELLIVIAIIGILATLVIANIGQTLAKARDAERKNALIQLRTALEQYNNDNGSYPQTPTVNGHYYSSDPQFDNCCAEAPPNNDFNNYIPNLAPKYIRALPLDPKGGQGRKGDGDMGVCGNWARAYLYRSDGNSYALLSHCSLESGSSYPKSDSALYDPNRTTWALKVCVNQGCDW